MQNQSEKRLLYLIRFLPASIVFIFSIIITFIAVNNSITQGKQEIENIKKTFIRTEKNHIKNEVKKVIKRIVYERNRAEVRLKENIREKVEEAYAIAYSIYRNNRDKDKQTLTKMIKDALREVRFNKGRGYYFIYSMDLKNILLPVAPQLEGSDFSDYRDVHGDEVVKNIAELIKKKNETFYTWYWHKPQNKLEHFKKIGFAKYFKPLDFFIGTGEYVEDFENEIKKNLIAEIQNIRYGTNGYIFMHDYNGVTLAHINTALIGVNRLDIKDKKIQPIIQEIINLAKQGGGFIEYKATINPLTHLPAQKISYIEGYQDWGWQIGAGLYTNDINNALKEKQEILHQRLRDTILKVIVLSILTGLLLIYTSLKLSKLGENAFKKYKEEIRKKTLESEKQLLLLQQQNKLASMGEMIGNIAHQWRQPLNTLSISISKMSLLSEDGKLTQKSIDRTLVTMENSIVYLSKTIDVFRNFFLASAANEVFNIKEEIQNTIEIVHDSYKHHSIKIYCDGDATLTLKGDKKELQQVLMNLLSNAKDAIISKQQTDGQVAIHIASEDKKVKITVEDNGGGVEEEIKDKIFAPYFTTKFKSQGTGVGLYMSQIIIEKHFNGTLSFKNKNDGVEFTITI